MRKRLWSASLFIIIALFVYITCCVQAQPLSNEDFLRFHVVANSNAPEDQALKLAVRDRLIEEIQTGLKEEAVRQGTSLNTMEASFAEEYLQTHLAEMESVAENVITEEGFAYSADAELGVRWIPAKTYGKVTFPAGNYKALTVTIGEGAGENWWCVLFPPLCLIDGEDPLGVDKKYEPLWNAEEPTTLKLKFKTLEILQDHGYPYPDNNADDQDHDDPQDQSDQGADKAGRSHSLSGASVFPGKLLCLVAED
ncbi:MAG: hypothetical protein E7224_06575 [Clostridiales bacterium]|nr:hypothetical protein [Clostridiales bacterium]